MAAPTHDVLTRRLRRAGSVFAEEEAAALIAAAHDPGELEGLVVRREAGEFLEHVLGAVELCGLRLSVGPGCFVPRRRTELLIAQALAEARTLHCPLVVEAYCGVAPVAALLGRHLPDVRLHVTDSDPLSLVHARRNLPPGAGVHRGEGLSGLPEALRGAVDLLVAVPPYVPAPRWALLPRDARENEDRRTLIAGEDGLAEVRHLLAETARWLAPGGTVLVEMHRSQIEAARRIARERGGFGGTSRVDGEDGETVLLRARRSRPDDGRRPLGEGPASTGAGDGNRTRVISLED